MSRPKLTQSRLKELLHYDPNTGVFTWLMPLLTANSIHVGDVAGGINNHGYRRITINNKSYLASRLAWLYMEGYFPEHDCDHINRVKDDDRWENLRHVSHQCNTRNRCLFKNNSSGITGVYWHKQRSKWNAHIRISNKSIHLGCFKTKTEAAKARWEAEVKYNFTNCTSSSSAYLYLKKCGAI